MDLLVQDIIKLYPLSRARLLAGKSGLMRTVASANIQEVPNVERWLQRGEVLFTAGYAFRELEDLGAFMERIERAGVSAVFVKPGQYLQAVPREMIDAAERLKLPLFSLPEDISYMNCIVPIFEQLTNRQLMLLRRTESIYAQLMQTIVRQEGLDGICETLHSVTGQEIVILSASGKQILAKCVGQYGDEDLDEDQLEFIRYFFEQSAGQRRLRELKPNQCGNLILGERHALCVPIYAQTEKIAYLLLSCTQWHIPDMDVIAFEHASSLIAIELLKERALVDKEQKVREKLLEDVFMKRYADEQMLYRRGFSLGIDLKKPYAVFTIDPDEFEHFVRSEMRASTEAEVQTIKDGIQSIIYAEMTAWPHPTLLMNSSVRVYGLVTIRHTEDKAALQRVLGSIVRRLANFCPKLRFQIGISQVKSAVQDAPSAQQEAALAASCAKLPQFEKEDGIVFFENLGAMRFLNELKDSSAMQSYYEEHMKALIDYDREHNTELVNTLECYFRCNRNLRVTAETLFIHKNSAIYRIRKIESLTGSSISAGADAFDLQMCLLLKTLFPADHA